MCLRVCTGFKGVSFREAHLRALWSDRQIALITSQKVKRIRRVSEMDAGTPLKKRGLEKQGPALLGEPLFGKERLISGAVLGKDVRLTALNRPLTAK